jgi:S-adenosyl-L-methionine hydrolase (adenosine-forming)
MPRPLITLTTDFGLGSPYVAQMKGVILSLCREAELIDITHAVGPQNVREGAIVLADATPRFPPGTIHLAVVDPGVGTTRRMTYAEIGEQRYLAPDNGLLSFLTRREPPRRIISLENSQIWLPNPSHTFHGRDIFAPVAAHLANGLDPADLGPARDELFLLDWPEPRKSSSRIAGEVLYVDSFGNLVTNIMAADIAALGRPASLVVECGGREVRGLVRSYAAAMTGEFVALLDSQGRLEIAVVNSSAARELHLDVGEPVVVSQP